MNIPTLGQSIEIILDKAFDAEKADECRELELRPVFGKAIRLNSDNEWQEHFWEDRIPFWGDKVTDNTVAHGIRHGEVGIFLVPTWAARHVTPIELHRATGRKLNA